MKNLTFFATSLLTLALASVAGTAIATTGVAQTPDAGAALHTYRFDLPAQPLSDALRAIGRQIGQNVMFDPALVEGKIAPALQAKLSVDQAITRLLAGTQLTFKRVESGTILLTPATATTATVAQHGTFRVAQSDSSSRGEGVEEGQGSNDESAAATLNEENEEDSERGGIPEILVTGSKLSSLNADIRRTEDDIQPYVVFERERIIRSGANNLEEFFKNELTASVSAMGAGQKEGGGSRSQINLRGLGADETLILIDGRRVAGFSLDGDPQQADINGIPLAAVERIEVLPTTASGIFGGGATGGVINIVLRRDYKGFSTQLTYGNTFGSDAATRRLDINGGFSLEGGRTNVLFAASYSDANPFLTRERSYIQRGRQYLLDRAGGNHQTLEQFGIIPPLGATTNVRSLGGNLVLDPEHGGADLGSAITHVPRGYAGVTAATDGAAALIAGAGRYNLELAETAQQGAGGYGLLSAPEVKSLMMTLRRQFSTSIQAFLEFQASESSSDYPGNFANLTAFIPGDAATNPFEQSILVTVPTVGMDEGVTSRADDRRAVAGVMARLPREWQAIMELTWNRTRSSYSWPRSLAAGSDVAVSDGSVDVLRDLNQYPVLWEGSAPTTQSPGDMELKNTAMRLAGPLPWSLPGGKPTLTSLVELREESLDDVVVTCVQCGRSTLYPERSQTVSSVYVEAQLPIVSALNGRRGLHLLDIQLALRGDQYRITGVPYVDLLSSDPHPSEQYTSKSSSIDPTVGFRYRPVRDLTFRASYGTGYLPPSMTQLVPLPTLPDNLAWAGLTDPLRGDEPLGEVDIEIQQGGNPDLQPEESESWSAGVMLMPRDVSGLRIALDWSRISKVNNIKGPFAYSQDDLETLINYFPDRIVRAPSFDGTVGRIIGLDTRLANIARTRIEALDLAFDYEVDTDGVGTLGFTADATRVISLETQATPSAPSVQNAGILINSFDGGALKWKANASIRWSQRRWTVGWRSRYVDSYFFELDQSVNARQGTARVPSQVYHDIYGGYQFAVDSGALSNLLANTEIRFGVNNVFNREPPIDIVRGGPTMYSRLGDPRLANYFVSLRKNFGQ